MSLRAIHSAASGMEAHQFSLDVVANNLANASTTSFKRSRTNFEDMFYQNLKLPGTTSVAGNTGVGTSVGLGTRVASTSLDFKQGSLRDTNGDFDMAIVGQGFFQVDDNGTPAYIRAGNFTRNAEGQIVVGSADSGRILQPAITVPPDATDVSISGDGRVNVSSAGQIQEIGQIQLYRFVNPQGLLQRGENLFVETPASGAAVNDVPGSNGLGSIRHRVLEASNVEPVRELVDLIKTQRNFELNSQTIKAADQMLQLISNLRQF
ncbi:MAG: flagellar basal-body rod protein FlgG [Planctomycetota bacterium]|nr:flagellar basal-body rod protein FlgG [Planctomycetota bacterium]MDA1161648.1 flagellar basal-body rod protein FlgG [Planctomycetota bacterium]